MKTYKSNVSFRVDEELKQQADNLFYQLGLTMTTAFNIFLRQSVREGSLPFAVTTRVPNDTTIAAMREAKMLIANTSMQRYNIEDALKELKE